VIQTDFNNANIFLNFSKQTTWPQKKKNNINFAKEIKSIEIKQLINELKYQYCKDFCNIFV